MDLVVIAAQWSHLRIYIHRERELAESSLRLVEPALNGLSGLGK